jgi:hypothetical protein
LVYDDVREKKAVKDIQIFKQGTGTWLCGQLNKVQLYHERKLDPVKTRRNDKGFLQ